MSAAKKIVFAILCFSSIANAGDQNEAAAERLFEEGRTLLSQGRTAEACDRFAASEKLSRAGGTVLNLAECWAKLGRTASAYARFRDAASLARAAGRADVDRMATDRADALEKDLPYIHLAVESAEGVEVKRDGESVPREVWNTDVPVDPGEHVVEASRSGFITWKWKGQIAPRDRVSVSPTWVPLETPPARRSSVGPILGWSALGAGVVGLGLSAVLAGIAASQIGSAKATCPDPMRCGNADAVARSHDAKTLADGATVSFIFGAVFAGAGAGVLLAWPREK